MATTAAIAKLIELAEQLDNSAHPATDVLFGRFTRDLQNILLQYDVSWSEHQRAIIDRLLYWVVILLTRPQDFMHPPAQGVVGGPHEHIARITQSLVALMRASSPPPFTAAEDAEARAAAANLRSMKS